MTEEGACEGPIKQPAKQRGNDCSIFIDFKNSTPFSDNWFSQRYSKYVNKLLISLAQDIVEFQNRKGFFLLDGNTVWPIMAVLKKRLSSNALRSRMIFVEIASFYSGSRTKGCDKNISHTSPYKCLFYLEIRVRAMTVGYWILPFLKKDKYLVM